MPPSKLSALQQRVLVALASISPPWALTGGGALAGFHYGHRTTRDLDLFWHGRDRLERLPDRVAAVLRDTGLSVSSVQAEPAFHQLIVSGDGENVVVDLVADPVPVVAEPEPAKLEGVEILVDSPVEIFANKLCALLGRSELRDLVDVRVLLDHGLSLDEAIRGAATKDGGFSPLTLAWIVKQMPIERLAPVAGADESETAGLLTFRDRFLDLLTRLAAPSGD